MVKVVRFDHCAATVIVRPHYVGRIQIRADINILVLGEGFLER